MSAVTSERPIASVEYSVARQGVKIVKETVKMTAAVGTGVLA